MASQEGDQQPQSGNNIKQSRGSSAFSFGWALSQEGRPTRVKRLDRKTKVYIDGMLRRAEHRAWCLRHGKTLPPPRLHPVILRVIREWFDLVDDDGSGTLEHHELLAALQAARIPCDASNINEMIKLMDANRDGCIGWNEFEAFMMDEFAAGKHLLSGEYVLPSGMALPFGVMIRQLKRSQMLKEITEGGESRRKWLHYDVNLTADAKAVAEAEEQIRHQKAFDETLHNREVVKEEQQQSAEQATAAQGGTELQQEHVSASSSRRASSAAARSLPADTVAAAAMAEAKKRRSSTAGRQCDGAPAGAATTELLGGVAVIAGVPVVAPRILSAGAVHQQQPQHQQRCSTAAAGLRQPLLAAMHAAAAEAAQASAATAAAAASAASFIRDAASLSNKQHEDRTLLVPRLQLSRVARHSSSSSSGDASSPGQQQQQPLLHDVIVIEPGSVLAAAKSSYWLNKAPTEQHSTAADSVADHLYQHKLLQQQLAVGQVSPAGGRTSQSSPRFLSSSGGGSSGGGGSPRGRDRSPSLPSHVLQPQPCRDEWNVLAASSLALDHSSRSGASQSPRQVVPRGGSIAGNCISPRSSLRTSGGVSSGTNNNATWSVSSTAAAAGDSKQMQQQQQQQQQVILAVTERPVTVPQLLGGQQQQQQQFGTSGVLLQAVKAVQQTQQDGSYKDVCVKHLLSVRATPPGALLSQHYVGPVAAAIATAHTPRSAAAAAAAVKCLTESGCLSSSSNSNAVSALQSARRAQTADTTMQGCRRAASPGAAAAAAGQQSARVGTAVGGSRSDSSPRSARAIVPTNAGDAVTVNGQVLRYIVTPRQMVGNATVMTTAAASCTPRGLCANADANLQASAGNGRHSMISFSAAKAAAIAAAACGDSMSGGGKAGCRSSGGGGSSNSCSGSRGSQASVSPRHSVLAQRLVRVHSRYGGGGDVTAAKQSNPKASQQQQQPSFKGNINGNSSSTAGSDGSSKDTAGHEQLQQGLSAAYTAGFLLPVESSSGSIVQAGAQALSSKQARQQKHNEGHCAAAATGACSCCSTCVVSQDGSGKHVTAAAAKGAAGPVLAGAAEKKEKQTHYAASGPLGGHHPAYANSYNPSTNVNASLGPCCSTSGSQAGGGVNAVKGGATTNRSGSGGGVNVSWNGGFGSLTGAAAGAGAVVMNGGSSAGCSKAMVSPRLSYSGLTPRGRKG